MHLSGEKGERYQAESTRPLKSRGTFPAGCINKEGDGRSGGGRGGHFNAPKPHRDRLSARAPYRDPGRKARGFAIPDCLRD